MMSHKIKTAISSTGVALLTLGLAAGSAFAQNVDTGNFITGANSVNEVTVDLGKFVKQVLSEHTFQSNFGAVNANTGDNEADKNTGDGEVWGGGVSFDAGFHNLTTTSMAPIIYLGNLLSIDADNKTTGYSSLNTVDIHTKSKAIVDVVREVLIDNTVLVDAKTGDNTANKNTGDAEVHGGEVRGSLTITNITPASGGGVIKVGTGGAEIDAGNQETGAQSLNAIDINAHRKVDVDVAETTVVSNTILQDISTGGNQADKNTGDASVESGDINSHTTITNTSTSAAPVVVDAGDPVKISADNKTTGYSSDNQINIDQHESTIVDVDRTTVTSNNLSVSANTGGNSANKNTGDGTARSGSVDIDFRVINSN